MDNILVTGANGLLGCEFKEIRKLLPVEREELLKLEVSRKIFDREIGNLIMFLHDKIFNK